MFSSLSDYDWRYLLVTGLYARCPKNMRLYRFYKKYFSHKLKFVQNCLCLLDRETVKEPLIKAPLKSHAIET